MPEEARSELRLVYRSSSRVAALRDVAQQLSLSHRGNAELVKKGSEPKDFLLRIRRNHPLLELDIVLGDSQKAKPSFDVTTASTPSNIVEHWGSPQHLDEEIFPEVYSSLFFSFANLGSRGHI